MTAVNVMLPILLHSFPSIIPYALIQWGSKNRPLKIQNQSKYGLFEGQFLNGLDFEQSGQ